MFRHLLIPLLAGSTIATAASARVGPEIAYSSGNEIFLVNPDGSNNVRIFRGKGSGFIDSVSLRPGGGTIAFVDNWVLRFMNYTTVGLQSGPIYSLPGCYRQHEVQFAPDGQSVIYGELCNGTQQVKRVAIPTAANPAPTPQLLFEDAGLVDLGNWDASGESFVYSTSDLTGWKVRRRYLNGDDVVVTSLASPGPQLREPAISGDGLKVIAADWNGSTAIAGTGFLDEFDVGSGQQVRVNFTKGKKADYSPAADRVLFVETEGKTTYLRILSATGLRQNVARSGAYLAFNDIDWGN